MSLPRMMSFALRDSVSLWLKEAIRAMPRAKLIIQPIMEAESPLVSDVETEADVGCAETDLDSDFAGLLFELLLELLEPGL